VRRQAPRRQINEAAIDAWQRADWGALHEALGLSPACFSPLPASLVRGYGLPEKQPTAALDICETWPEMRALQYELREIAGEPGSKSCAR
jgi:hypothetical protein